MAKADLVRDLAKTVVYGAAEVATCGRGVRRRINGQHVRFGARWSRYYPSSYEVDKHAFLVCQCRPGTTGVDLGAHIGLFTAVMARAVAPHGRVLAFEPTPSTRAALERTIRLNRLTDIVEIRSEAVWSSPGHATFFDTTEPCSNVNSLVQVDRTKTHFEVPTVTLDEIAEGAEGPISCVKLDVEGAEYDALVGGERLLEETRPALAVEVHPAQLAAAGRSVEQLWERIRDHDLVALRGGQPVDRAWFCEQLGPFEVQILPKEATPAR